MKSKTIVIKPKRKFSFDEFKEIWNYRELLLTLVERDFKVRYKQTVIGFVWAVIQPLTTMVVFSFFFGRIAKIPSDGVPYPIFSYSGVLLWVYFSGAVANAASSLVGNSSLISKVYFPRVIVVLASTMVGLVDYLIAGIILFFMMVYYRIFPGWTIILLPLVVLNTWILATGVGMWLAATNVLYRDVKYLISFLLQLWIYATPVIYPLSVAGVFKWMVMLNPMTGLIETHRAILLGLKEAPFLLLGLSIIISFSIFISGFYYFRSLERKFADVI
jgi:lipopolysaccharide transport system permease protein